MLISKKKLIVIILSIPFSVLIWKIFTYSLEPNLIKTTSTNFSHIQDESRLTSIPVFKVVKVKSEQEIAKWLKFAKKNNLKVSIAGKRHSMGGQSIQKNGIVLDMTEFNKFKIDKKKKELTAQSGATWLAIQKEIDKAELSIIAMQSINIFTIGGSLSVNAHGIAHNPGHIAPTVKSIRVMLANGDIRTASLNHNPDLFRHIIGGYGLFGVILDATFDLTDNQVYERKIIHMNYTSFPDFFNKEILNNPNVGLFYGRLSISPISFLKEATVYKYTKVDYQEKIPLLKKEKNIWLHRLIFNFSKTCSLGKWLRSLLEKNIEPYTHPSIDGRLVSRNQEMFDSMGYLQHRLTSTDILQEYFLPIEKMPDFIDGVRTIVQKNRANLLNITIRFVHNDTITALPYAKGNRIAFVLYFNRKPTKKAEEILEKTTVNLIELSTSLGGRFYLPYQLYYSHQQLQKTYPEIKSFFEFKKQIDPEKRFSNQFYEKYSIEH